LGKVLPTLNDPIWNSVVQDIAEYDHKSPSVGPLVETLQEPLRRVISKSINQAREGLIEIPDKNDVVLVTLRLLDNAKQSVRATSYINPEEWWQSDIAPAYGQKLKATMQHVKVFQRLFLTGSTEETKRLKPVMDAQQRAGLEVKFACASNIAPDRREDFIVVDQTVAAALELDRVILRAPISFQPRFERKILTPGSTTYGYRAIHRLMPVRSRAQKPQ
jgi:hypothetical protein